MKKHPAYPDLFTWCLTAVLIFLAFGAAGEEGLETVVAELGARDTEVSEGMWGRLEFFPVYMEPADAFYEQHSRYAFFKDREAVWRFYTEKKEDVQKIFLDAGFEKSVTKTLTGKDSLRPGETPGTFEIRPPEEIVLGMTDEQRSHLYARLYPKAEKNLYFRPIELPAGGFAALTAVPTGISPKLENFMEQLCFVQNRSVLFSDLGFLLGRAGSEEERLRVMKTLLRERSFNVRLRVPRGMDLVRALNFWSAGGRNNGAADILDSAARNPSIAHIDLVHLLPPTPKKLLHTYPTREGYMIQDAVPDCYWTALSFFIDEPPERYLDEIGPLFEQRFDPVTDFMIFGDLVVVRRRSDGKPVHACNYLAGNLVFTKNGFSAARPWVISTLKDVTESYLSAGPIQVSYFRLKPEYRF